MQHQPSGHASEAAGLPEGQSGVWPPADLQPAPPAQQPMLQQQGSGGTGQSPVQPHLAGSWQWQQPSDPRLRTRMQPAQQPAASQHPLQQCYPPQPTPQHTWQQPAQHAGQQLPAQHAGLPLHRPLAGASTPPHPAWGLPAAVDAHNVGRVLVGRDQLVDVVHLERELQREAPAGRGAPRCVAHALACRACVPSRRCASLALLPQSMRRATSLRSAIASPHGPLAVLSPRAANPPTNPPTSSSQEPAPGSAC